MNTIETDYYSLQKEVDKILIDRGVKELKLIFSIFEDIGDDNSKTWGIKAPDLKSVFSEGKVKFIHGYYNFKSKTLNNPTWADVAYWANESILWGMRKEGLDGWDHVFLEMVEFKEEVKGVKVFEFWFGS